MTTYYIGADVHSNRTKIAIEKTRKIVANYIVPTTILAILNILDSLQGKKQSRLLDWLRKDLWPAGRIAISTKRSTK